MDQTSTFPRNSIRTMRKDLKKLREADVVKEKEKIIKAEIQVPTLVQKQAAPPINLPIHVPIPKESKILGGKATGRNEESGPVSVETEKQKAFLLKQQQAELEAATKKLQQEKQTLAPQKDALIAKKEKIENSLKPLVEQQASATEDDQQVIEKKRWPIEQELEKLKSKIAEVNAKYETYEQEEVKTSQTVQQTKANIDTAKSNIQRQEEQKKQETAAQKITPPKQTEDQRKKKFMEDIEAWASSQDNK